MNLKDFLIIILKLCLINSGYAERTKDQMYEIFDGRTTCFRRLNATHQVGCSSKKGGSTGIIHYVETLSDLNFIMENGTGSSYIPVMPLQLLKPSTLKLILDKNLITGIVLYNNSALESYTHERSCPNQMSNVDKTCNTAWNPDGSGILYQDLPFPVHYVNDDDLDRMKACFSKFNNYSYETHSKRSLCSVELDAFMFASTNTPTCRRRSQSKTNLNPVKFCDPLGGENVWSTLFPMDDERARSKSFVALAARLDTTSLFNGVFPGAASPIASLVTFLSTADYLKRMVRDVHNYEMNVLFLLFNGETYDYIGSQRVVYDMERGEFPLKSESETNPMPLIRVKDIELYLELSHLSKGDGIFVHNTAEKSDFFSTLQSNNNFSRLETVDGSIPPASIHSFLKENAKLRGAVIANYKDAYVNKFFNSIFDNVSNVDYHYYNTSDYSTIPPDSIQSFTANVSEMLARSIYSKIVGRNYSGGERVRIELVDELYNCYLLDADCKVHQAVQRKKLRETPYNSYGLYVGVTVVPNLLTYAIGLTLAWLTGDVMPDSGLCVKENHTPLYQYFNMSESLDNLNSTLCYRTTMNFSEAVSPAFIIDDYDWKSGKYSSWSESTWKDLTVRMFLKPAPAHERFTLAIGSITMIMSMIVIYFVKTRADVLFATAENCSPTNC
ncbi:hypothetical protein PPYR_02807 [Photinus pyralis]|uniref:Nicastrin n=1 Tax=Photinus pyralis TaxID=7054 RepID=A0A5N4A0Z5_PHOPY|nr:nicastrin [Photinus pyralis]KAB0791007.1 hypothetical protein PPYR_02807 [Photinus pyralis]